MSLLVGFITFLLAELIWNFQFAPAVAWPTFISVPAGLLCCIFAASLAHKATWRILSMPENALNNPAPLYTWKNERVAIEQVLELLTNYRFHGNDFHIDHNERQKVRGNRWFSSRHWTGGGLLGLVSDIYSAVTLSFADIQLEFAVSVRIERYNEFNSKVYIEFTNEANPKIINIWGAPIRTELMQKLTDLLQTKAEPYTEKVDAGGPAVVSAQASTQASISETEVRRIWQAASDGDVEALLQFGRMYAHGYGVPQSWPDAASCIGMAASKGNRDAMYEYGTMLCQGLGVAADPQEGMQWYQAAALQGHTEAQLALQAMIG